MRIRFVLGGAAIAAVALLVACGHPDRVAQIRVGELAQPSSDSEGGLQRDAAVVRKRLSEVADLLGLEEQSHGEPPTIVKFSQLGTPAPVELTARSAPDGILVEVSQRAPKDSGATVFEKARLLVRERLEQDFGKRVSETTSGGEVWSSIRSENVRTK
jgi:hypothetical protein